MDKQIVFVTGGTDGVGKALAHALADIGTVTVEIDEYRGPETIYLRAPDPIQDFCITDRRRVGKGERKRNRANRYR